jgi:glycolate oxidase iron-sulfur subunit
MALSLPQIVSDEKLHEKLEACVHCGLCLPACPTYQETLDEADSPRGRIYFMRAIAEERIEPSPTVLKHLDRCLVCRACETVCPSTVHYHELIETVRPTVAEKVRGRGQESRALAFMLRNILTHPKRAAAAMLPLKIARKIGLGGLAKKLAGVVAKPLAEMTEVLPKHASGKRPAMFTPAVGEKRGSVVMLLGCVGAVVGGETNADAVFVLSQNGFDVHLLANETCCGALAAHANEPEAAADYARRLLETLGTRKEDYFVSAIAGCGAQLKALNKLAAKQQNADATVAKMRDVTELLAEVGLRAPTGRIEKRVTYHDPCHLVHGQKISAAPRKLLAAIPGVTIVPLPENDLCCGAAGSFNLSQPEMAGALGRRKANNVISTSADLCATANIGCQLHISRHLHAAGCDNVTVEHIVTLLAESYRLGSSAAVK